MNHNLILHVTKEKFRQVLTGVTSHCSYSMWISSPIPPHSLCVLESQRSLSHKCLFHVGMWSTMVANKQRGAGGVIYRPPPMFVSHQASRGCLFRSRSGRQRQTNPRRSSQPASHHPLRNHHGLVCFDEGLVIFKGLENFLSPSPS